MATRIATDLARADLKMRPAEWLLAWAASPFVFVAFAYIAGFIFPGFQNIVHWQSPSWWACSPALLSQVSPGKAPQAFGAQLPDTITLLANSLRAGSSFLQGIELVTREARPPISEEFSRVVRDMQLGLACCRRWTTSFAGWDSEDLELMVTAIQIQSQVGGNLAHGPRLDRVSRSASGSGSMARSRRSPAMQRYSGYVITLLPVGWPSSCS